MGRANSSHPTDPKFKPRIFAIAGNEGPHWTENTGEVPYHAIRVEFKHPGCGLAGWKAAAPAEDDALVAAAGAYKVLLENAEVRVLELRLGAHEKDAFHTHPWPGFYYVVRGVPVRVNGKAVNFPAGVEIVPVGAEGHSMQNVGDGALHLIRFELKFGLGAGG